MHLKNLHSSLKYDTFEGLLLDFGCTDLIHTNCVRIENRDKLFLPWKLCCFSEEQEVIQEYRLLLVFLAMVKKAEQNTISTPLCFSQMC